MLLLSDNSGVLDWMLRSKVFRSYIPRLFRVSILEAEAFETPPTSWKNSSKNCICICVATQALYPGWKFDLLKFVVIPQTALEKNIFFFYEFS